MRYFQAMALGLMLLACMNCSHVNLNYQQGGPGHSLITSRVLTETAQSAGYLLSIEPAEAILRSGQWQDFKVSLKNKQQLQMLSPGAVNWQVTVPQVFHLQRTGRGQALHQGRSVVKVQLKTQPHIQAYSTVQVISESAETLQKPDMASSEAPQALQPTPQTKASAEPAPRPEQATSGSEPLDTPPSGPPVPERMPGP